MSEGTHKKAVRQFRNLSRCPCNTYGKHPTFKKQCSKTSRYGYVKPLVFKKCYNNQHSDQIAWPLVGVNLGLTGDIEQLELVPDVGGRIIKPVLTLVGGEAHSQRACQDLLSKDILNKMYHNITKITIIFIPCMSYASFTRF